jgi:uncharacterized protein
LHREEMLPLVKGKKYLIVDDIYDTGDTFAKVFIAVNGLDCDFAFLMARYKDSNVSLVAKVLNHEKWIVFPWEKNVTKYC